MTEENEIPKRIVDARAYTDIIRELTSEGREVPLLITGNSMNPFLVHERDRILVGKPPGDLKKGDMVFYRRENGQYVMHRICRSKKRPDGETVYYMIGDAQRELEGPIAREQIFGRITMVCRKGRWIGPGDFWWEFFARVWIRMIPLRRFLLYCYGILRKRMGRKRYQSREGGPGKHGG